VTAPSVTEADAWSATVPTPDTVTAPSVILAAAASFSAAAADTVTAPSAIEADAVRPAALDPAKARAAKLEAPNDIAQFAFLTTRLATCSTTAVPVLVPFSAALASGNSSDPLAGRLVVRLPYQMSPVSHRISNP
jgi:hypothetical protein